jgi:hypothetical protein
VKATALSLLGLFVALMPGYATAGCIPRTSPTPASSPSPEPPLYSMADDIFTRDRDGTLYYFFRSNPDGSAVAKREIRYDRNLWDTCAQLQIRLPFITRYPITPNPHSLEANPYSGFGDAELRYSYNVASETFDHSIEVGAIFPTASNGVARLDTELKLLYAAKWKWQGGTFAYISEYDQTVIRPPATDYTSYYEGKLSLPSYSFVDSPAWRGLKVSALYDYRVFFSNGGIYKSAVGGIISGSVNDIAVNVVDTWGVGTNVLWKYRVEASAAARF